MIITDKLVAQYVYLISFIKASKIWILKTGIHCSPNIAIYKNRYS